jgi:hypothetical protein
MHLNWTAERRDGKSLQQSRHGRGRNRWCDRLALPKRLLSIQYLDNSVIELTKPLGSNDQQNAGCDLPPTMATRN